MLKMTVTESLKYLRFIGLECSIMGKPEDASREDLGVGKQTGEFGQMISHVGMCWRKSMGWVLARSLMGCVPLSFDNFLPGLRSACDGPVLSQLPSWQWL